MVKRNKLAIFDLDGTLFDTKNVNYKAYSEAISFCGFDADIDYAYYCDFCNGNNYKVFLPQIIPGISKVDMEKIHELKKTLYSKYLNFAEKNEHLFSIIDRLRDEYVIALVTTASKVNTLEILFSFSVTDYFDLIITQEDVKETKPSPECFEKAMEIAAINKTSTIIFEDSDVGLKAAASSGANYVKVYGYN